MNSLIFFSLKISLLHLNYKIFPLGLEFWVDRLLLFFFFHYLENILSLSFNLHSFKWEVCCILIFAKYRYPPPPHPYLLQLPSWDSLFLRFFSNLDIWCVFFYNILQTSQICGMTFFIIFGKFSAIILNIFLFPCLLCLLFFWDFKCIYIEHLLFSLSS